MTQRGKKPDLAAPRKEVSPRDAGGQSAVYEFPPPEDLSPLAVDYWRVLIPDLAATGVYRQSDGLLLRELVESLAQARYFMQALIAEPDKTSQESKRARSGYREMMQTAMSIAGEFGISPVARLRLGLMKAQGATLLDKLGVVVETSE